MVISGEAGRLRMAVILTRFKIFWTALRTIRIHAGISADTFLGVPFNIASYALLTMMIAQVLDYEPAEFVHTFGDLHLYSNHFEQAKEQLSRTPRALPTMKINLDVQNLFDFKFEDFSLENYDPWPTIKAPIAV